MPTQELSPEIQKIQETVVGMYSENPWPLNRRTDEEMSPARGAWNPWNREAPRFAGGAPTEDEE